MRREVQITTGKNMEGSNLVFSVGADSRLSICSKTANGRRFDQQLHVKLRNVPNSLCFVDTLSDNMVLSCSNSNYLLTITEIALGVCFSHSFVVVIPATLLCCLVQTNTRLQ